MQSAPNRMSIALLCAVLTLCIYRAATQSFTIDESFTFLHFVNVPVSDALAEYSANNHILQTLMMRVSRYFLGRSEIVLRIPNLVGCALYLLASYRITSVVMPGRWLQPLALALMTLNPLVLDLLVAARGYSLALGLSWWSLYLAWSDLETPRPGRLWRAGISAGLAIAANLVFVIPLALMGVLLLPLYARRGRFWELIDSLAGPTIVIAFILLIVPLAKSAGQFYFGVKSLSETTGSLVGESLRQPTLGKILLDALDARMGWMFLEERVIPVLFFAVVVVAVWLLFRTVRGASPETILLFVVLGMFVLSVGCWVVLNRMLGVLYPFTRTAVYVLPLAGFAIVLAASRMRRKLLTIGLSVVASLIAVIYVSELRTTYFSEWRSEAGMKRLMRTLRTDARDRHNVHPLTAGGSWNLEYSVRYYGVRYRMPWLKVLNATERESTAPDYYLLTSEDQKLVDELHLKVIDKDDVSGTILARRS
jgi:hypothetical protein